MPPPSDIRARLAAAPDPDGAKALLDRLFEAGLRPADLDSDNRLGVLFTACATAPYLATLAIRDPARLLNAADDPYLTRPKPPEVFRTELAARTRGIEDTDELDRALRAYRAQEFIRLGARENGFGTCEVVDRELAHLADAAFHVALAFHDARLAEKHGEPTCEEGRARLVVMGMGKLGGEELNFSSDVDVIYLYTSDAGSAGELTLHEYFSKLARLVTASVSEPTEEDSVFRVDLRLRPEGSRGPIVNSLHGAESYYESFGRPWERQAWIKARPSAGDIALGNQACAMLAPFVFPRTVSPTTIADVEHLNQRIKRELVDASDPGFDVKLGIGGIREIEFFVQALQLVHGGKNPALRERSTRGALDRLLFAGLIADREARALRGAYDFLRRTEHMVQLEAGLQTHRVPDDPERRRFIAQRLGFPSARVFTEVLGTHTQRVQELFRTLGTDPEPPSDVETLFDLEKTDLDLANTCARLGFRQPADAAFWLGQLRARARSPFGPTASPVAARAARLLVVEIVACPDPDQALRFVLELVSSWAGWSSLWRTLAETPAAARLLVSVLGTSEFLARTLVARPDLLDGLVLSHRPSATRTRRLLRRELAGRLADIEADDEEGMWAGLNLFKAEELLRAGLADIAGALDETHVTIELSNIADVCLEAAHAVVARGLEQRHGPLAPMTVIALGKQGGRELGYASDLDLVFVFDGDASQAPAMAKLAQRLVSGLGTLTATGRLYPVDTRLRPSGSQGTLVSSLEAWRRYHAEAALLWERQALVKARPVAGDRRLGKLMAAEIEHTVYSAPTLARDEIAAQIVRMRRRMEKERAREGATGGDIKLGRGGLVDIEFAAQYLQLAHGHDEPSLRVRSTVGALDRARSCGLLSAELARTLSDGYRFLRRLEHRMRIVSDRPVHELPRDPVELEKLARRVGLGDPDELATALSQWTERIRAGYLQVMGAGGLG